MLNNQYEMLETKKELDIVLFCGGGGADTGIEQATGYPVDIAINHDPEAIGMHAANHPQTVHFKEDVFAVHPLIATRGRPIRILWASPDCTHFSIAKGGTPCNKKIRSLAWVVIKWAKIVKPRMIFLENVKEFQTWGPLGADNRPDKAHSGETFKQWVEELRKLGYQVEWKVLSACDYGAPTSRKRLFLIARCDGQPIVWPKPSHGDPKNPEIKKNKLKPWRNAAEVIDWSIPCPSIFERKKPLSDNTLRRIAKGIQKFVINNPKPFIVSIANYSSDSINPADKPLTTITASPKGGHHALVTTFLARQYGQSIGTAVDSPLGTITRIDHSQVVTAFLAKHYTGAIGSDMNSPVDTITAVDHNSLVLALLVKYYGNEQGGISLEEPLDTITTKDRLALITVYIKGEPYIIVDINIRMLQPHELFAAQGFPATYIYDRQADGTPITKTAQVQKCGNAVCPPVAKAIVAANLTEPNFMEKAI